MCWLGCDEKGDCVCARRLTIGAWIFDLTGYVMLDGFWFEVLRCGTWLSLMCSLSSQGLSGEVLRRFLAVCIYTMGTRLRDITL